jgi:GDPmannose 4,6-dehydratase
MKKALITGVTGQDGAYLAALLLEKGYSVAATHRRSSSPDFWRIEHLGIRDHPNLRLYELDLVDLGSCIRLVESFMPDEIYNLAAQTHVGFSFQHPLTTAHATAVGPLHFLEAIRLVDPRIRYYQASSAEMFGKVQAVPQNETTPFYPRSPYGVSKLFSHWMTINYRESYGIFGCSGILFNHESPLRGMEFVTRKIIHGVARIKLQDAPPIELGNLDAKRDWGYAPEYVEGMWRMMQAAEPDTYVLATGRSETVRDFATIAFKAAGIEIAWIGQGEHERAISPADGRVLVRVNPLFYRPAEVDMLRGDSSKAQKLLGWRPKATLEELASLMLRTELQRVERALIVEDLQRRASPPPAPAIDGISAAADIARPRLAAGE